MYINAYNRNINLDFAKKIKSKLIDNDRTWIRISANPNITWEIIQSNPDIPWDKYGVSMNPNITYEIVKNNPQYPWDFHCMLRNPSITLDNIKDYTGNNLARIISCLDIFFDNPNITWEIIVDLLNSSQEYHQYVNIGYIPNYFTISIKFIETLIDIYNRYPPFVYYIDSFASRPEFNWDIIKNNLHIFTNWDFISMNPNITIDIVENNPQYPWDYGGLSMNPNITLAFVEKYVDRPWNWSELSKKIPIVEILNNQNKPWVWNNVICRRDIKLNDVLNILDNYEINLDEFQLRDFSQNVDITLDIVLANPNGLKPNLPWNWRYLSLNRNITWNDIIDNPHLDFYLYYAISFRTFSCLDNIDNVFDSIHLIIKNPIIKSL